MLTFFSVLAIALVAVLLVELPDKTLIATLVLSSKYRPGPVLIGVGAAFAVQCALAVTAGGLLRLLPHRLLEVLVGLLFALGAFVLVRESLTSTDEEGGTNGGDAADLSSRRIALLSFGVLFAAEWGDASQLATAGLSARYGQPAAIGLGAFLALMAVASLAVVASKAVISRIPLVLIHRVAAVLFAVFAVVALISALRG